MKAQTQALTTVLITTVIVGAAASTYVWGQPLLEKQQSQSEIKQLERQARGLYSTTNAVSRSGSGHRSQIEMNLPEGSFEVNDKENYMEITVPAEGSPYASTWTLMEGSTKQNTSVQGGDYAGEDAPPGVLAVRNRGGSQGTINYRIEYRNVRDGEGLRRVDLQPVGSGRGSGDFTVALTNTGSEIDSSYEISTGETFELEKTIIEVDIQ